MRPLKLWIRKIKVGFFQDIHGNMGKNRLKNDFFQNSFCFFLVREVMWRRRIYLNFQIFLLNLGLIWIQVYSGVYILFKNNPPPSPSLWETNFFLQIFCFAEFGKLYVLQRKFIQFLLKPINVNFQFFFPKTLKIMIWFDALTAT